MLKNLLKLAFLAIIASSCLGTKNKPASYPRMIGDISTNPKLDTSSFTLCNADDYAIQYYAFTQKPYQEEKHELEQIFLDRYNPKIAKRESGLIRIRFVVNCNGEAGRYRIIAADENYKEKQFDASITDQLLEITKHSLIWKPYNELGNQRDYYMYLIFKINNGHITEILP